MLREDSSRRALLGNASKKKARHPHNGQSSKSTYQHWQCPSYQHTVTYRQLLLLPSVCPTFSTVAIVSAVGGPTFALSGLATAASGPSCACSTCQTASPLPDSSCTRVALLHPPAGQPSRTSPGEAASGRLTSRD